MRYQLISCLVTVLLAWGVTVSEGRWIAAAALVILIACGCVAMATKQVCRSYLSCMYLVLVPRSPPASSCSQIWAGTGNYSLVPRLFFCGWEWVCTWHFCMSVTLLCVYDIVVSPKCEEDAESSVGSFSVQLKIWVIACSADANHSTYSGNRDHFTWLQ